jgi:hypothetical protein
MPTIEEMQAKTTEEQALEADAMDMAIKADLRLVIDHWTTKKTGQMDQHSKPEGDLERRIRTFNTQVEVIGFLEGMLQLIKMGLLIDGLALKKESDRKAGILRAERPDLN